MCPKILEILLDHNRKNDLEVAREGKFRKSGLKEVAREEKFAWSFEQNEPDRWRTFRLISQQSRVSGVIFSISIPISIPIPTPDSISIPAPVSPLVEIPPLAL